MELIRKDFIKGLRLNCKKIKGLRLNSREKELTRKSFMKQKRHQPLHLYQDNTYYFITSHTYKNVPLLKTRDKKNLLFKKIKFWFEKFGYKLYAWVILNNHYHLLCKSYRGTDLPVIISKVHTGFSYEINKLENKQGRKIWQNYWDKFIRSEKDLWMHFNYIHQNPIKHMVVNNMEHYEFSSYNFWKKNKGIEWIETMFRDFPIINFTIGCDD